MRTSLNDTDMWSPFPVMCVCLLRVDVVFVCVCVVTGTYRGCLRVSSSPSLRTYACTVLLRGDSSRPQSKGIEALTRSV